MSEESQAFKPSPKIQHSPTKQTLQRTRLITDHFPPSPDTGRGQKRRNETSNNENPPPKTTKMATSPQNDSPNLQQILGAITAQSQENKNQFDAIRNESKAQSLAIQTQMKVLSGGVNKLTTDFNTLKVRVEALEAHQGGEKDEVTKLKEELLNCHEEINYLKYTQAKISDETRQRNLLLMGMPEDETNYKELISQAEAFIAANTGLTIKLDGGYRFPKRAEDKIPPVKVFLPSLGVKIQVLEEIYARSQNGIRPNIKSDLSELTRKEIQKKYEERLRNGRPTNGGTHERNTGESSTNPGAAKSRVPTRTTTRHK